MIFGEALRPTQVIPLPKTRAESLQPVSRRIQHQYGCLRFRSDMHHGLRRHWLIERPGGLRQERHTRSAVPARFHR